MNFKSVNLISFLLLLIIQTALTDDDEYFEKSIFRTLKTKNGQFKSKLNYLTYYGNEFNNRRLIESYDFKRSSGRYFEAGKTRRLHINGQEEYEYYEKYSACHSIERSNQNYLLRWAPESVYNLNLTYKLTGPSVLLEVLMENYEKNQKNVKCINENDVFKKNAKKCSVTFNETVKLDYNFEDKDEYTMFPVEIQLFKKNQIGDWKLRNKLIYLNFTPIFDEKSIVSTDLPTGLGCKRISPEKYPKIETNYGRQYELEFETVLNYTERKANQSRYNSYRVNIVRSYSTKMYVDLNKSMNIAEAIDEITNASIRTFYNTDSHQMSSVNLDDHKCSTYNLTLNESLNWFYLQDSFVKKSEVYHAKNYSYLKEQNVDDVLCLVFERKFLYFKYSGNSKNEKLITNRLNKNKIKSSDYSLISTHYYPKNKNYWSAESNGFVIPKKIKIRIRPFSYGTTSRLTIKIKSFNSSPKEQENYDSSKCKNADSD